MLNDTRLDYKVNIASYMRCF